jgi:hypothetical protein
MAITAWDEFLTTNWLWLAQAPRDPAIEFDVGDLGDGEVAREILWAVGLLKNGMGVGLVPFVSL